MGDPQALLRDLRSIQRDFQTLMAALTGEVGKKWGANEVKLPSLRKNIRSARVSYLPSSARRATSIRSP